MNSIAIEKKDELVMRLTHYFITQKNYTPIIVNGVKNEVWLENIDGPYRIIRINSNYIHNNEQFNVDINRTKSVLKQIKKQTLSFNVSTLNIFLDVNERVDLLDMNNISSINVNKISDVKNNKIIIDAFPDIENNLLNDENGIDLIINVTNDINEKTAKDNKVYDKIFKKKNIIMTYILIAICLVVFVFTNIYPMLTYLLANNRDLFKLGDYYRIISCIFVHGGILHLLCNMYSLYILGTQVETFMGKVKFILIYLISGIVGSAMSMALNPGFSVGASGAIFGLMGSLFFFGYHYRLYLNSVVKNQLLPLLVINLIIGFTTPGIDNFAHIGGLIGGYLSTMALGIEGKSSKKEIINGWVVLILLIGFLIGFTLFK